MFFGWAVVAAAFTVIFAANSLQHAYGVLLPAIEADLNTSRAALSAPYSLFILVYSVLAFPAGWLTDRYGPRAVVCACGIALGVGFAAIGTITQAWELLLYFGLLAGIGKCVAFVPPNVTVARWFVRRRGIAIGLSTSAANVAVFVAPPLASVLIVSVGWRGTCMALGAACIVLLFIAGYLMYRDPEALGLYPDGDPAPTDAAVETAAETAGWTLGSARSTHAFWTILGVYTLAWIMLFVPYAHMPSHALDLGFSATLGASLVSVMGVGGLLGRPAMGWLSDRFGIKPVLAGSLALQSLGFALFATTQTYIGLLLAASLFGIGAAGVISLFTLLVVSFFGRANAGTISGVLFSVSSTICATGPYIAGTLRDLNQNYDAAFLFGAACSAVAALAVAAIRAPRHPPILQGPRSSAA